jgi:hypothetical protein
METINSDLLTIFSVVVVAIGIFLLIAGAGKKVVIYYNGADMGGSFLAVALPLVALWMLLISPFESPIFNWSFHWIVSPITGIIGGFFVINNFKKAIKHNRSVLIGVIVGVFKILFVSLSVLAVFHQVGRITDKKSSFKGALIATIFLVVFVAVAKAMINGPQVYEAKGWTLPA